MERLMCSQTKPLAEQREWVTLEVCQLTIGDLPQDMLAAWNRKIAQMNSVLIPGLQYHFSIGISIDQLFLISYSLNSWDVCLDKWHLAFFK